MQTKKFKKTVKSLNNFWKQSMFTTLFLLYLNSLNLPEERDTFQMIPQHPTNAETFWKIKELSGQSKKFPDILESFHTIWKLSRHYGNFPDNMESVYKTLKV